MGAVDQTDVLQVRPRLRIGRRQPKRWGLSGLLALLPLLLPACVPSDPGVSRSPAAASIDGTWRVVLDSPGGDLPFSLRIATSGDRTMAVAFNGDEEVPFSSVERDGDRVLLHIDHYDSRIEARVSEAGTRLSGSWSKTSAGGESRLALQATRGDTARFSEALPEEARGSAAGAIRSVEGTWSVLFTDEEEEQPARAAFRQQGERLCRNRPWTHRDAMRALGLWGAYNSDLVVP